MINFALQVFALVVIFICVWWGVYEWLYAEATKYNKKVDKLKPVSFAFSVFVYVLIISFGVALGRLL